MKKFVTSLVVVALVSIFVLVGTVSADWVYLSPAQEANGSFSIGINGFLVELTDKLTGFIEGQSADSPQSMFNGSVNYDSSTSQRWTSWAESDTQRGEPITWVINSTSKFTFDEIRIHHFCDAYGCDMPESIAFSYVDDNGNYSQLVNATLEGDGAAKTYNDKTVLVTVNKNWSNPTRGMYRGATCFQATIGNSTVQYYDGYTGVVPYTSFVLNNASSSITTNSFKLTLDAPAGYFVGLVELEFYLNGQKLDFS